MLLFNKPALSLNWGSIMLLCIKGSSGGLNTLIIYLDIFNGRA
jgi:hypothetical protein